MTDIAISVKNLSKSYLVGHKAAGVLRDNALRDVIARSAHNLARKTRDMLQGRTIVQGDEIEEFWALKDVSFEIKRGDVVGIIGRNGAGKSTLLKVLSRITEPTHGRIEISGRVASLLEVGTGFHSELSGRENIFLNGAILGMSRREIQRKFDEIVSFAEVEQFLDTPVKRYSSGMYVRLAFAVAAHLEPEILIVDEVLAVGDQKFQQKCLGIMHDVAKGGRTVLLVTHNMVITRQLCTTALLLEAGTIKSFGTTATTIKRYEDSQLQPAIHQDTKSFHIRHWWLGNGSMIAADRSHLLKDSTSPDFCFELFSPRSVRQAKLGIHLRDVNNALLISLMIEPFDAPEGVSHIHLSMKSLPLMPGIFHWQIGLVLGHELVMLDSLVPELEVNTASHVHPQPEWHPMINLPYRTSVHPAI